MTAARLHTNRPNRKWGRRLGVLAVSMLILSACGSGGAELATSSGPEEAADAGRARVVTPGRANWSTGYFQAAVYSALLEELGYEVADPATNEYQPSEAYIAMAEGTIDFWPNGWYTQHDVWHDQILPDGTRVGDHLVVIGNQLENAGFQGLVITKSVANEHSITSLDQINDDPDLAALFDVDGNGLGDIFGCPEDWTCDNVIDEMIASNGWTNLEQTKAGYPGMIETSIQRVEAGEPAIQYTWSPSGYLAQLIPGENVLWLSMGDEDNVLDGTTESGLDYAQFGPAPFGATCSEDPCWPGWEVEDIRVTSSRAFAETHADAAALFEVVEIDVAAIAEQNTRYDAGENTEVDIRRAADEWIAENRSLVDEWLATARAADR